MALPLPRVWLQLPARPTLQPYGVRIRTQHITPDLTVRTGPCRQVEKLRGSAMATVFDNPLSELGEQALFSLLGNAWYSEFKPQCGEAYELNAAVDVGKRQLEALVPALRLDLAQPTPYGLTGCVANTIARNCSWQMPPNVLAAIVVSRRMAPRDGALQQSVASDTARTSD